MNLDVQQMVTGLTEEARKRIVEALPGEAGRVVSEVLKDPNALLKDPGKVVGAEADKLKGQAEAEAKKRLEGAEKRVGEEINKGLEGLLNRDRKKEQEQEKQKKGQ
jgi:hypothetical protein